MLDSTQTHQGIEALLITYSGSNEDAGISQYVPVTPGVQYVASAWVKSEELQSANGPRLGVYDGYRNLACAQSEETLGTSSWHRVQHALAEATGSPPNCICKRDPLRKVLHQS